MYLQFQLAGSFCLQLMPNQLLNSEMLRMIIRRHFALDWQTDRRTELLLLAPCAEFEATFKFPFKIGSRHSLQTRANLTKPTAVTILLTHMACMAYTHLHTHTRTLLHAGYTLEQLSAVTDRARENAMSCFRFLWFAQPVGTFWLRWTWHKIKCSILIELSASYNPSGRSLSPTTSLSPHLTIWCQ